MGIEVGKIDIKTKCLPNKNSVSQILIGDGHRFKFSFSKGAACPGPRPDNSDIKLSSRRVRQKALRLARVLSCQSVPKYFK